MYKEDLVLNNQQGLICYKNQTNLISSCIQIEILDVAWDKILRYYRWLKHNDQIHAKKTNFSSSPINMSIK